MELRERRKSFAIHPYGFRLVVFITTDVIGSFNRRNFPGLLRPSESAHAFVWTDERVRTVYCFLPETSNAGTIAHEMFHVVAFVMKVIGAALEEEVWAYHLEALTQSVFTFVQSTT